MTYKEVATMISTIGLPYAYNEFPDGTQQEPPFICFLYPSSSDFIADGINYQRIRQLVIELYTPDKNIILEEAVESCLLAHDLAFTRDEVYIGAERMFQIVYTTEIVLTEESTNG